MLAVDGPLLAEVPKLGLDQVQKLFPVRMGVDVPGQLGGPALPGGMRRRVVNQPLQLGWMRGHLGKGTTPPDDRMAKAAGRRRRD